MNRLRGVVRQIIRPYKKRLLTDTESLSEIFVEIEEVQIKKQRIKQYIEDLEKNETMHQYYGNLDEAVCHQLNKLRHDMREIEEQKTQLKGRLLRNNLGLHRLIAYEQEIPTLIKEMQIAEKRQREIEGKITYLQEEKVILQRERETLLKSYNYLKGLSMILIICIGGGLLLSFILLQVLQQKIWYILSGLVILTMIFIIAVILIKEDIEREIKKNGMLQKQAARNLNRAAIKLFHHMQYLNFQYNKLGVESVAKLEIYYNRYIKSKHNEEVYLKMNKKLDVIEQEILTILSSQQSSLVDQEDFVEWFTQLKHDEKYLGLKKGESTRMKEQLAALEDYEQTLWDALQIKEEQEDLRKEIQGWLQGYQGEKRLDKIHQNA